jgi:hypothetical protein
MTNESHPLALALEYFEKGRMDFPVLTGLIVSTVYNVFTGVYAESAIDRLPHGEGERVREVCTHFGLQLIRAK